MMAHCQNIAHSTPALPLKSYWLILIVSDLEIKLNTAKVLNFYPSFQMIENRSGVVFITMVID